MPSGLKGAANTEPSERRNEQGRAESGFWLKLETALVKLPVTRCNKLQRDTLTNEQNVHDQEG